MFGPGTNPVPVPLAPGTEADENTVPAIAWLSLTAMLTPCGLLAGILLAVVGAPAWVLMVTAAVWLVTVVAMWRIRGDHPQWTLLGPVIFSAATFVLATVAT